MHVLILNYGERYEGSDVRGAFSDTPEGEARARAKAARLMARVPFDWRPHTGSRYESLVAEWTGGCDYITLVRHEVVG